MDKESAKNSASDSQVSTSHETRWVSLPEAAQDTPYSSEYLGLLARRNKLFARKIDGVWHTTKFAVKDYIKSQKEVRKVLNRNLTPLFEGGLSSISEAFEVWKEKDVLARKRDVAEAKSFTNLSIHLGELETEKPKPVREVENTGWTHKSIAIAAIAIVVFVSGHSLFRAFSGESLEIVLQKQSAALARENMAAASVLGVLGDSIEALVKGFGSLKDLAIAPFKIPTKDLPGVGVVRENFLPTRNPAITTTTAIQSTTPTYSFESLRSDLKGELESFILTRLSQVSPVTVYENNPVYNNNFRSEILLADTRPTVTRQSTSDVESVASIVRRIQTEGVFENAVLTNSSISGPEGFFANFAFTNATGTAATTTDFFSTNAYFENIVGSSLNLSSLIFGSATGTSATTTNFFSNNLVASNGLFSGLGFMTLSGTDSTTTNATSTNFFASTASTTNLFANLSNIGSLVSNSFTAENATSSTFAITGNGAGLVFYGSGNHDISAANGTLRIGSNTIIGNIEAVDSTVDIGTPGVRFDKIYANEVNANNVIGNITGGNILAETLSVNFDNPTNDTEDSFISFQRGSTTPNALMRWNSTNDRLEFNSDLFITPGTGTGSFLVYGSTTLQNFTAQNSTTTNATTTNLFISGLASTTNFRANTGTFGNIGIGTTNPGTSKLDVSTNGSIYAVNLRAADGFHMRFADTNNNQHGTITAGGSALTFGGFSSGVSFNTGNVGFGTASPHYRTEVNGVLGFTTGGSYRSAITPSFFGYNSNWKSLILGSTSTTYNIDNGAVTVAFGYDPSTNASGAYSGDGREVVFRNGQTFITPSDTNDNWYSTLTMRDGSVGIGTTNPQQKLEVAGIGRFTGTNAFSIGGDTGQYRIQTNTSQQSFAFLTSGNSYAGLKARTLSIGATYGDEAAPSNGAIIQGNVGIGTTNPDNKLHIFAGDASTAVTDPKQLLVLEHSTDSILQFVTPNTRTQKIQFGDPDSHSAGAITYNHPSDYLSLTTNDSERLRIDSSGNVGIGTTTPDRTLTVNGGVHFGSRNGASPASSIYRFERYNGTYPFAYMYPEAGSGESAGWNFASVNSGSVVEDRLVITGAGNVGIGTTTPAYKLSINSTSASENLLQISTTTKQNILVVNSAGNVGIGTTTPSAQLAIEKSLYVSNSGGTATSTFEGNLHVLNTLQVGTGSTHITTNSVAFSGGGSISNNSGKLQLQAGGTGTGSTGTGSIYFLDSAANTRARIDTVATTTVIGSGDGADGAISLTTAGTTNCQTTAIAAGRSAGDCIATAVSATAASSQAIINVTAVTGYAAGDEVLIIQMAGTGIGAYEFKTISSVDGGTSTITVTQNLTNTYTTGGGSLAQVVRVPNYTNVTIGASGQARNLTVSAWDGAKGGILAFRATGTVTVVNGSSITVSALGFAGAAAPAGGTGGAGGGPTGNGFNGASFGTSGSSGTGPGAGTGGTRAGGVGNGGGGAAGGWGGGGGGAAGLGSGAGGGSYGAAGGSGTSASANGGSGTTGDFGGAGGGGGAGSGASVGTAGSTYGAASLSSLYLGSGGGSGAGGNGGGGGGGGPDTVGGAGGNGGAGGAGGNGGGILFIEADVITNGGNILANGANGANGSGGGNGGGASTANSGSGGGGGGSAGTGGGGGSGGSLILKANTISAGTATASGGSGGNTGAGGAGGSMALNGANGAGGGGAGNNGGAGGITNAGGGNGGAGGSANAAGGAGGSGRVRCDTASGSGCSTTPSADQNVYTPSFVPTTNGYGTLYIGQVNTVSADLAEYYVTGDRSLEAGDLVCLSNTKLLDDGNEEVVSQGVLRKCSMRNDPRSIGIISTSPGVTLGSIDSETHAADNRALALSGRVPTKVSTENGAVAIGDSLTTSSIPGVAMKATGFANVIGVALENFNNNNSSGEVKEITIGSATTTVRVGKVSTFVSLGQKKLDVNRTEDGKLITEIENFDYDFSGFNLSQVKSLSSLSGKWSLGEDGTASTTKLCVGGSCLGESDLSFMLGISDLFQASSTVTSTATTTEETNSFTATGIFQKIWASIVEKFASAANGIGDFFANRVRTKELCVGDGSGETCITKSQLDSLLAGANIAPSFSGTTTPSIFTPVIIETEDDNATSTEEIVIEDDSATSTPEIISEEDIPSDPEVENNGGDTIDDENSSGSVEEENLTENDEEEVVQGDTEEQNSGPEESEQTEEL